MSKRDLPKSDPGSGRKSSHLPKALCRGCYCPSGLPHPWRSLLRRTTAQGQQGAPGVGSSHHTSPEAETKWVGERGLGVWHRRWAMGPGSSSPSRVQDGQRRQAAPLGSHGDGGLVPLPRISFCQPPPTFCSCGCFRQASSTKQGSAQAPSCPACCVARPSTHQGSPLDRQVLPRQTQGQGQPGQRSSGSRRTQVRRRSPAAPEPPAGLGQLPAMENCTQGCQAEP